MAAATAPKPGFFSTGALFLLAAAIALVATGVPRADRVSQLEGWGLSESTATAALYIVPVIALFGALMIARAFVRGRSAIVRMAIYGGCGAVGGFILAFCLDLFVGVPNMIASVVGPLGEHTIIDIELWALAGMCIALGLMVGVVGVFGRKGAAAIQIDNEDPEILDIRRNDQSMAAWSAVAMIALGLSIGGLVVARVAEEGARGGPAIVAVLAAIVSVVCNVVLWRRLDEMQRGHVLTGYTVSAIFVTAGAFFWALAQAMGFVPALDAAGLFGAITIVQMVGTMIATGQAMGQASAREQTA